MVRACSNCHKAKVKCMREDGAGEDIPCIRCRRLGFDVKCEPHISRQGQGPRRSRKKQKAGEAETSATSRSTPGSNFTETGSSNNKKKTPGSGRKAGKSASQKVSAHAPAASAPFALVGAPSPLMSASSTSITAPMDALAVAAASMAAATSAGGGGGGSFYSRTSSSSPPAAVGMPGANTAIATAKNKNSTSHIQRMGSSGSRSQSQESSRSTAAAAGAAASSAASATRTEHGAAKNTQQQEQQQTLDVEDEIVCKGIHDLGYNHFGLHHLIRMWTCLSYTRRSFNLLARASFLASRCGISMDEVLSNESPFAKLTNAKPLSFLQNSILLPKQQQVVLGPRLDLMEIPSDLLEAVLIDPRMNETHCNRWFSIRMTHFGKIRLYNSPNFERDFATTDEMERTWIENKKEIIDLFLTKSSKTPFGRDMLNHYYLNKEPNKGCFVTRYQTAVKLKSQPEQPVQMDLIHSMKIVDLDTEIFYMEVQSRKLKQRNSTASTISLGSIMSEGENSAGKRSRADDDDDPLMSDDFDFTELPLTDELEEWMGILGQEPENSKSASSSGTPMFL